MSCAFLHLRQRRLGLGQPEGHVHGPVQVDGSGQRSAGLLRLVTHRHIDDKAVDSTLQAFTRLHHDN